ncbi:50S ribosomal protein L25/general stress protein Ctc [uncultured Campylobacter sp.]|uniref:50S ribosomal protein L25/general stress protein Ctc n=1 Tax=uncultured Campylobacter sp. TaxID=218934 RepID=UPI0026226462|nr:50S ribosomal protein L25/general stress protein Ctc [uncultured Campylobacter sp.]
MLEGIVRESIGKKAAKALKRDGYLIANIYAKGVDNVYAAFKTNEFIKAVRAKETLAFDVKVGDSVYKVVVEEYQKHPVTNELTHVDLRVVHDDVLARYFVPITITGSAIGLKNRGILVQSKRRLPVQCKGKDLPNEFVLDVTNLDVADSLLVRDVEVPKGVKLLDKPDVALVGVLTAK